MGRSIVTGGDTPLTLAIAEEVLVLVNCVRNFVMVFAFFKMLTCVTL